MNGVGVWHMSFAAKRNEMTNYFVARNALIFTHYSPLCGFCHFVVELIARCGKRFWFGHLPAMNAYLLALDDYAAGYEGITAIGADVKYAETKRSIEKEPSVAVLFRLALRMMSVIKKYPVTRDNYRKFREEKLHDDRFWKHYLGMA